MTTVQALFVLAHLAQPGPYVGYGWRVQQELDARDRAAAQLAGLPRGTREWRAADIARCGAEARLARLLNVQPPPPVQLILDDPWLADLYAQYAAACALA